MTKYLVLIIMLFSLKIYSQEIVSRDEIYSKDSLAYKLQDDKLFTGKIQNFKHKTHLVSEIEFVDGILQKTIVYFNGQDVIVCEENYYFSKSRQIEKKIRHSFDQKIIGTTYYEKNGNKKLEEEFKDGILIYSCPYTNNKKNGKLFSIDKNGEKKECVFENGKFIKNI